MPADKSIGFIGGGNMAEAIIKGVIAGGVGRDRIFVSEPQAERRRLLAERYDVSCVGTDEVLAAAEVVVLAVKPQVAASVLAAMVGGVTENHLLVSIMAGVTTSAIERSFPRPVRVVRVMPNTPALVLQAASAVCGGAHAMKEDIQAVRRMFELVGKAWLVEEKLMDAVTGLSGSGPAYVFTFIEALSDAGVKNGLPREVATGLAAQTVYGAAKLLLESREHPAVLRESVTSPGGTTIAGLQVLERLGLRGAVMESVEAAVARSAELGKGK